MGDGAESKLSDQRFEEISRRMTDLRDDVRRLEDLVTRISAQDIREVQESTKNFGDLSSSFQIIRYQQENYSVKLEEILRTLKSLADNQNTLQTQSELLRQNQLLLTTSQERYGKILTPKTKSINLFDASWKVVAGLVAAITALVSLLTQVVSELLGKK